MSSVNDSIDVMVFIRFNFGVTEQNIKRIERTYAVNDIILWEKDYLISIMSLGYYNRYRNELIKYPHRCFYKEIQLIIPKMKHINKIPY